MDWTTEESWFDDWQEQTFLSSSKRPDQLSGPSNLFSNGYWGLSPQGGEADQSPPPSSEVKNASSRTSTSPYALMAGS